MRPAAARRSPLRALRRLSTFRSVVCIVYRHARPAAGAAEADIRPVTADNLDDARSMEPPERLDEFRSFLARGDRGWYAYLDGRVVHRSWLVRGPAIMRLWSRYGAWPVSDGEAYVHYCETVPAARGRGLYPAVLDHIAREQASLRGLYIACESSNQASRRGIEKAGFAEIAHVTVRVLFGFGLQSVRRV